MGKQLFSNHASSLLAATIDDNDLTIQVESGYGALFPNPGANEEFIVTLRNASGDYEYCRITSRSTDLLTVATGGRGYDGSTAQAWTLGVTRVEYRLTKKIVEEFIQRSGDTMSGNLDMGGNEVQDAELTGTTIITGGQTVGTAIRGALDDSSNEIAVPSDGSRATAGGAAILTETDTEGVMTAAFDVGMIMAWYGALVSVPAGWQVCDGTNGTPDLRGKFIMGVSGSHAFDSSGGAETAGGTSDAGGGHTPAGTVGETVLDETQIPSHRHQTFIDATGDGTVSASTSVYKNSNSGGDQEYSLDGAATEPTVGRTSAVGGGLGHTHSFTGDAVAAHTHGLGSISVLPPYKALYYIMFVGF